MIAVYDSGLGGLGAWRRLRERFPKEDIVSFADTAHLPYGEKSPACLYAYAKNAIDFLCSFSPRKILVACGTVSATVLPLLAQGEPRLMGVICPTAQAVAEKAKEKGLTRPKILVLATQRTVASDAYGKAITACLPGARVQSVACPAFVPALEGAPLSLPARKRLCDTVLPPCLPAPDLLVLGCTHYPLLRAAWAERFPHAVILDAGEVASDALVPPGEPLCEQGRSHFYVSGDSLRFSALARAYGFRVEKAIPIGGG